MNTEQECTDFEAWWEKEGKHCGSGGEHYKKTFAYRAFQAGQAAIQLRQDAEKQAATRKKDGPSSQCSTFCDYEFEGRCIVTGDGVCAARQRNDGEGE